LLCPGNRQVICKSVKMIDDGSANLFVRNGPRPKIRRGPAGNARHARKWRGAEFFVFLDEPTGPISQIVEQPVDLSVQFVVFRYLPVGLLNVLNDVDHLIQNLIDGSDGIVR
jgi:hypothetical protein